MFGKSDDGIEFFWRGGDVGLDGKGADDVKLPVMFLGGATGVKVCTMILGGHPRGETDCPQGIGLRSSTAVWPFETM